MLRSDLRDEFRRRAYLLEIELCLIVGETYLANESIRALKEAHKCWASASDEELEALRFFEERAASSATQATSNVDTSVLSIYLVSCYSYFMIYSGAISPDADRGGILHQAKECGTN